MKKITQVLFVALLAVVFAACSGGDKTADGKECPEECKKECCDEKGATADSKECPPGCEKECCTKADETAHVCGDECKANGECTHAKADDSSEEGEMEDAHGDHGDHGGDEGEES